MYASKTPRDLNPHGVIMTGAGTPPLCSCGWQGRRLDGPTLADHIAEFDHVQHNEPNPILVAFRRDADEMKRERGWTVARTALSWDRDAFDPFVDMYDLAVLDHARRVLERLANLPQIEEEPEPTSAEEREYDEYLDQQFWGDH